MADSVKLPKSVFEVEVKNHELLKLAYDAYLANARQASALTKQRGEVRGGGKKPWQQKGTGRARVGSIRSPLWRGGGVTFGPRGNENYTKKLSTASKRVAIRQALTLASQDKKLTIIDSLNIKNGKTKEAIALLKDQKATNRDRVLLVITEPTDVIWRATNNLQQILVVKPKFLSVYSILNADKIIIESSALPVIEEWLVGGKNE